jgi:predicted metal-dependent phosphoesterase TrpH
MLFLDFHCHSTQSDGTLPPEAVVARAATAGCTMLALTDHDTVAGLPAAQQEASTCGLRLINGVEISVTWGKHTLHIVGLNLDSHHPLLLNGLASLRAGRIERARAMADALDAAGIHGAFEGALAICPNPDMIGRTHLARFMVASGQVKDVRTVFKKYLTPGKPGYVRHAWASLNDAVGWIRAAGGVAVLAHPGRYDIGSTSMRTLLRDFIDAGGEAIEVISGSHTATDEARFTRLALEYQLLASAGSDFHAPGEGGKTLGQLNDLPYALTPVWTRWHS